MVNGDPLTDVYDLLNVVMTIKGGVVLSEATLRTASARH
jgi:hypothetical protein